MFDTFKASRNIDKASKIISPLDRSSAKQIRDTNDYLRSMLINKFSTKSIANTNPESLAAYFYGVSALSENNTSNTGITRIYASSFGNLKKQCEKTNSGISAEFNLVLQVISEEMKSANIDSSSFFDV
ncbi:hypothetical protein AB3Y13_22945 [Vibrio alginolyticus]